MMTRMRQSGLILLVAVAVASSLVGVPVEGAPGARARRHTVRPGPLPPVIRSRPLHASVQRLAVARTAVYAQGIYAQDPRTMQVLLISANGDAVNQPSGAALTAMLDQIGIPYKVFVATRDGPLTMDKLASGPNAFYYAVMLETGNLEYSPDGGRTFVSALTPAEWQTLADFEAQFGVRQVTIYTVPTPDYGFNPFVASGFIETTGTLTTVGRTVFSHLQPNVVIPVRDAWTYLATALDATPLIVTPGGHALAALKTYPDGRENLAFTMDSNPYLLHTRLVAYGAINWVTKGLYLGQRRVYFHPQVDDLFISDDLWVGPGGVGPEFRISSSDLQTYLSWQRAVRQRRCCRGFRVAFAYNGEGTTTPGDPLTALAVANQGEFQWINHGYEHLNLDSTTVTETEGEIQTNHNVARTFGFSIYDGINFVTPDISGLTSPNAMQALANKRVKYVVSDWSIPSGRNPTFNTGIPNVLRPSILEIPRYPNNLFYNVSNPTELLSEFPEIHRDFCQIFPRYCPLVYDGSNSFLEFESGVLLGYLLTYDLNPLMNHQPNLREYQAGQSLLTDLFSRVFDKYEALMTLPIRTLTMNQIGLEMSRRAAYNRAGVVGTLAPGRSITITATTGAARIPLTGVSYGTGRETYGGQVTSYITLSQGASVVIPLPP